MYLTFKQERQRINPDYAQRHRADCQAVCCREVSLRTWVWLYDEKKNVLTKVYVEGIARSIKRLRMGREGHPLKEEPRGLYQETNWEWTWAVNGRENNQVKLERKWGARWWWIVTCVYFYYIMECFRSLGYQSDAWGAVWNISTVYKWYSWTCSFMSYFKAWCISFSAL